MSAAPASERLTEAASAAHTAEAGNDFAAANQAWRRYRLIGDTLRDPDELLAEGVALSESGRRLAFEPPSR